MDDGALLCLSVASRVAVACGLWACGVWGDSHGTARRAVEGWTTGGPGSPCGRRTKCETTSKFPEIQSVESAPPPFVTSR